ncbi:hypothetical protein ABVK25_009351 [Lepraria finkii]|uniref:Cytochrome P450 n=1 Tax=Lepraria finkii TaxID=1340010 RepID=A0ABR4AXS9_9LECA
MSPVLKNNRTDGKGLSKPEILAKAWLIVNAGSEITAGILGGTIYYLLSTGLIRKAIIEVREKFGKESGITAQLPYLLACLWEAHRMYPAGVVGQAVDVPPQGAAICECWIPGNTGIRDNQCASYRSKTMFKNPDDYIPERWFGDSKYASDQRTVFQPFAYGARNCISKGLANMEIRLVVARMIWNFDMELGKETGPDWDDQKGYMTWAEEATYHQV